MSLITASLMVYIRKLIPEGYKVYVTKVGIEVVTPSGDSKFLRVPEGWVVEEHSLGFGGWIIYRSTSSRFCRVLATPTDKAQIVAELSESRLDARSEESRQLITDMIGDNISLMTFEEQFAQKIAEIISTASLSGVSEESKLRQATMFSKGITDYLMTFPAMTQMGQQLPFYRNTIKIDNEFPGGIRESARDHMIGWLTDHTIPSPVSPGTFSCDPTSTSKNTPGTWITTIKKNTPRKTASGEVVTVSPDAPVMLLATQPLVGNRKRGPREMGGIKHALPLKNPRDISVGLSNGYEGYLSPELLAVMTRVCTAFIDVEGVNIYGASVGREEPLNLDDICLTPAGHEAFTALINERKVFTPDKWEEQKALYETDGILKPGITKEEISVEEVSLGKIPFFRKQVTITDADKVETWHVGKVLLDSTHKAMVKPITHRLVAVDAQGTEYEIECVISACSVKEKKIESMVLSAVLSRLDYGYVENPEAHTSLNRKGECKADDLVEKAKELCKARGDNENFTLPIYRIEEDGSRVFVDYGSVGFLRGVRLQENERSSSRVRQGGAISVQTPLRHLVRKPAILDTHTEHLVDMLINSYAELTGSA